MVSRMICSDEKKTTKKPAAPAKPDVKKIDRDHQPGKPPARPYEDRGPRNRQQRNG